MVPYPLLTSGSLHYLHPFLPQVMAHHPVNPSAMVPHGQLRPHVSQNPLAAIVTHPLRPHVLAVNQFTHWMTPYSINQIKFLLLLFPPSLIASSHLLLCNSVIPGTLSNYATGLSHFTNFCDEYNVPETLHMPASEQLLILFIIAHGASHVTNGTMKHWLLSLQL